MATKWRELIEGTAWVVDDLLTPEECRRFLDRAIEAGIEDGDRCRMTGDRRHRDGSRVELDDDELADRVFRRIRNGIPREVVVVVRNDNENDNENDDHNNDGPGGGGGGCPIDESRRSELAGTWVPYAVNPHWRIVRYAPGRGLFGPHRDGCRLLDDHHRSLITINGYLTDRPGARGPGSGATRFLRDSLEVRLTDDGRLFTVGDEDVLHRVEADRAGKAVVFFHDLMHDGEPVEEGFPPKWIFRTEVLFERDPATAPRRTDREREARLHLRRAEDTEADGRFGAAAALYTRAYRLDPSLEHRPR